MRKHHRPTADPLFWLMLLIGVAGVIGVIATLCSLR